MHHSGQEIKHPKLAKTPPLQEEENDGEVSEENEEVNELVEILAKAAAYEFGTYKEKSPLDEFREQMRGH